MANKETLIKIFEYALNQEKTGLTFFRQSLDRLGIGAAVTAFKRLVREEEGHITFISGILDDIRKGDEISMDQLKQVTIEPTDYFDQRAKSEFLEQCLYGSMVPDVTVFSIAWLIEKDLSEFYAKMAEKTDGKAKDALTLLASWEKEHERFFREYRDTLAKVYAEMPWGG